MESSVVVPPDSSSDKTSHFHLLKWTNSLLKTNFKDVKEMGSGDLSVCAELMPFHLLQSTSSMATSNKPQIHAFPLFLHSVELVVVADDFLLYEDVPCP